MDHEATITEQELERMLFDESAEPKALPLSLLERITNGFSYRMEIGRGGFAVVYKAMLNNGAVAVKRLSNTYMYENEFLREIECLMKVKHKNIVRFLGYCVDTQGNMAMYEGKFVLADIQQRLLCFEYLPNGGLNGYITDPSCGLEWRDRYNIIKGICEGLHHLHQRNIVHLDLKPANILLDECMKPKITDFGISRCFAEDQTRIIASKVVGTTGYMAPEFVSHVITQKYDLYSLGVIIMEILIGDKGGQSVDNVVKSWSNRLGVSEMTSQCEQIQVCAEIGIECIDFDPANRPVSVKHIIERLVETERMEGSSQIAPVFNILDTDITHNRMCSLDTNHAKQWIITGEEKGHVRIWNYKTQKKIYSFRLFQSYPVKFVKFIERKQWFAAGAHYYDSSIYVYSYETIMQKIMSISVAELGSLTSLAVHPTKPYLLSVHHQCHTIIWDWDKNWQRTEILGGGCFEKCQVAFSSQDTVAIPSSRGTVKVLSLDSPESNYTLSGHSERVNCLIFFTRDDQEYLVTGSDDLTAKIWDMQKKICLNTLRCMSAVMSILYRPDLQILITGSKNGDVHLWRTAGCRTYSRYPRLKGTVNIGHGVHSLACLMGRVLVGKKDGVGVMDIDNVCYGEESTYYSEPELREDMKPTNAETSKVIAGSSSELPTLDVHPLELCFPYAPNMSICCPLQLTNTTNERAAFRLMDKSAKTELYDIVPPKSTYTLIVTREENSSMKLVGETEFHLLLQSCTLGDRYIVMFTSQSECDDFFEEAQELGNNVHEVTLKCVYVPQGDLMFKALLVSRGIKIISVKSTDEELCSIYAHPTEGWIITGHANGDVRSWKHGMKKPMNSFKISERSVCSIKFVAKRKWIVAGAYDGVIHVFDCARVTKMQRITSFPSTINWYPYTISLAVHPANPYVLSTTMEIWNGDENWKRIHNFDPLGSINQVAFNPKDANIFATGSCYGDIKVWNIVSDYHESYPRGHTKGVNCLDFYTRGGRQYLISGSSDCTAKIWDMQEAVCIHTLDIMSPVISVIPLPHRPYIVTGSNHGTVQLWSSTDFRLTRTVNFGGCGPVRGLCSMGSRSVVIGQEKRITIMDIDKDAATWKKNFPLSLNNPPKIFSSIKETLIDTVSPCSRFSSYKYKSPTHA